MYSIENTDYGLKIIASGIVSAHEVAQYLKDVTVAARAQKRGFCIMIDAKELGPLERGGQKYLLRSHEVFLDCGVCRVSSVVGSPVARSQFIQLSFQSGLKEKVRHFDMTSVSDWEQQAMDWILKGIEPDKNNAPSIEAARQAPNQPLEACLSNTSSEGS